MYNHARKLIKPLSVITELVQFRGLSAVDEESAYGAERGQFFSVAEPAAVLTLRRGSGIGEQTMGDICESCFAKQFFPFSGGKQMRRDGKFFSPLVGVRVVAIIVDQDPGRAAFMQHAINFADAFGRGGPVVGRLD